MVSVLPRHLEHARRLVDEMLSTDWYVTSTVVDRVAWGLAAGEEAGAARKAAEVAHVLDDESMWGIIDGPSQGWTTADDVANALGCAALSERLRIADWLASGAVSVQTLVGGVLRSEAVADAELIAEAIRRGAHLEATDTPGEKGAPPTATAGDMTPGDLAELRSKR